MTITHSAARWRTLSSLAIALSQGAEALARLEAHVDPPVRRLGRPRGPDTYLRAFDARMRALDTRIDRELDRLTADRLRVDLAEKQGRRR